MTSSFRRTLRRTLRRTVCAAFAFLVVGCTHTVGFHPLPGAPPELTAGKTAAAVRLFMPVELQNATRSIRAQLNNWIVGYGARTHHFATTYLEAAFTDFQEVSSAAAPPTPGFLVNIQQVEYNVEDQAAHITMVVEVSDGSGANLLTKQYRADGWSGIGAAMGGGVFAEKGIIRSSTDQALKEMFLTLIRDLRRQLAPA